MNTVTFTEMFGEIPQGEFTVPLERIQHVQVWHDHSNGLIAIEGRDASISVTKEESVRIRDYLRAWHEPQERTVRCAESIAKEIVDDYHHHDAGSLSLAEPAKMVERIAIAIREARGES